MDKIKASKTIYFRTSILYTFAPQYYILSHPNTIYLYTPILYTFPRRSIYFNAEKSVAVRGDVYILGWKGMGLSRNTNVL